MRIRLFIASFIPSELSLKISRTAKKFQNELFRADPAENLHITYAFLGDREEEEIPHIRQHIIALNEQLRDISYRIADIQNFEQRGSKSPIVLTLELSKEIAPIISNLKKELDCDEIKPFVPHITIGKAYKYSANDTINSLADAFKTFNDRYAITTAVLAKSIVSPSGSVYSVID